MKNTYNPQSTKRRDLANYTIQVCHKFYTDTNNLSKDFPGDNLSNFYEAYENTINSLKVELRLNGLLTDRVDKGLNRIVSEIKSGDNEHYEIHLNRLRVDLSKNI